MKDPKELLDLSQSTALKDLGVRFVPAREARKAFAAEAARYGTPPPYPDARWNARCVAIGPEVALAAGTSVAGAKRAAVWWLFTDIGELALGLDAATPPALWLPVPWDEAGLIQAWTQATARPALREKSFRFIYGILPGGVADFVALENALVTNAACEPIPEVLGTAAPDGESLTEPEHETIFVTLYSRTRIHLRAIHNALPDGESVVVGQIDYHGAHHAGTVAAYNEEFGTFFPEDTPVDALDPLSGGIILGSEQLTQSLKSPKEFQLELFFAALVLDEPARVEALVRPFAHSTNPFERTGAAFVAFRWKLEEVLVEMLAAEPPGELRDRLRRMVSGV